MTFLEKIMRVDFNWSTRRRLPQRRGRAANPGHRPDIEYLRAIAVLAVIGFHWNVRPMRGGYVGVDVFFVISGYLITRMILSEASSGRFSFADFYERRARRLLPALYTVIAVIVLLSWFSLAPPDFKELSESILAVISFTSNFLFWQQAGYFDTPALEKPLLHTWSLAVEEQFYLVFPLLIWLLTVGCRKRSGISNATIGVGIVALASFAASLWGVVHAREATFYLAPFRAWEFLLGSLLVIVAPLGPRTIAIRRGAYALGLAAILLAVVTYRQRTPFPGAAALLPCLGAAICIWAPVDGVVQSPFGILSRVGVFFGRISYSLYLWHWPILVYAKLLIAPAQDFSSYQKLLMFAVAVSISYLSFRFIEQPVRGRIFLPRRRALAAGALAASAALVAVAAGGFATDGYPTRLDPIAATIAQYANYPYQALYREGTCFLQPQQSIAEFDKANCLDHLEGADTVLLWGDSTAAHFIHAMSENLAPLGYHVIQANAASCPPLVDLKRYVWPNCKPLNDMVHSFLIEARPQVVILSAHWLNYASDVGYARLKDQLQVTISFLDTLGLKVVLLGPSIQYTEALPGLISRSALPGFSAIRPSDFLQQESFVLDRAMQNDFDQGNTAYVSILDSSCPNRACPSIVKGSIPLEWDGIHLTAEGSEFVVSKILPQLARALPRR